jgi:hypothetical protein
MIGSSFTKVLFYIAVEYFSYYRRIHVEQLREIMEKLSQGPFSKMGLHEYETEEQFITPSGVWKERKNKENCFCF